MTAQLIQGIHMAMDKYHSPVIPIVVVVFNLNLTILTCPSLNFEDL